MFGKNKFKVFSDEFLLRELAKIIIQNKKKIYFNSLENTAIKKNFRIMAVEINSRKTEKRKKTQFNPEPSFFK